MKLTQDQPATSQLDVYLSSANGVLRVLEWGAFHTKRLHDVSLPVEQQLRCVGSKSSRAVVNQTPLTLVICSVFPSSPRFDFSRGGVVTSIEARLACKATLGPVNNESICSSVRFRVSG